MHGLRDSVPKSRILPLQWKSASSDSPDYFLNVEYLHKKKENINIDKRDLNTLPKIVTLTKSWNLCNMFNYLKLVCNFSCVSVLLQNTARPFFSFFFLFFFWCFFFSFFFSFYGPEIGGEAWMFPWDLFSISVLFIWLHSNSPSSCGQPMGITRSLETQVIISSSTICTLGSQLILCSQNNPFSTLLLLLCCCL